MLKLGVNDFAGALADAEAALSIKPHLAQLWGVVASLRYQLKNLPGAIEALGKGLKHDPNDINYRVTLGEFKRQAGDVFSAIILLRQAIVFMPELVDAWVNLGAAFQQAERITEAKSAYFRVLQLSPRQGGVANNLGALAKEEGDFEQALRFFEQAVRSQPNCVTFLTNRGAALNALKLRNEAVTNYRLALSLEPDNADAHYNLGNAVQQQGKLDAAGASYRRALGIKQGYVEARANLGKLLWDRGNLVDAVTEIEHASCFANEFGVNDIDKHITMAEYTMFRLILLWVGRCYDVMPNVLATVKHLEFTANVNSNKIIKNINAYNRYLASVYSFYSKCHDLYEVNYDGRLVAIGDSHTLSLSGVGFKFLGSQRCGDSRLITGIKMWHVGQAEGNFHRACLVEQMQGLPIGVDLLLCIGEIDCRMDEGIWSHYKNKRGQLEDIVTSTVTGYLRSVAEIVASSCRAASVTVQGIPAPAYPAPAHPSFEDAPEFLSMIAVVNKFLEAGALAIGWNFLDVYSATCGEDGASNGQWHLDGVHLQPGFYCHAERWLKQPT